MHHTTYITMTITFHWATLLVTWKVNSNSGNRSWLKRMFNCLTRNCSNSGITLVILQLVRNINWSLSYNLVLFTYPLSFLVYLGSWFRPHLQIVVYLMLSKRFIYYGSLFVDFAVVYVFMVVRWVNTTHVFMKMILLLWDLTKMFKTAHLLGRLAKLSYQYLVQVLIILSDITVFKLAHEFYVLEWVDLKFCQFIIKASFTNFYWLSDIRIYWNLFGRRFCHGNVTVARFS